MKKSLIISISALLISTVAIIAAYSNRTIPATKEKTDKANISAIAVFNDPEPTRLRGAMVHPKTVTEKDLEDLSALGANHIRWPLSWEEGSDGSAANMTEEIYGKWLEAELKRLDTLLPACEKLGLWIVIDMHSSPGWQIAKEKEFPIFRDAKWRKEFIASWKNIAIRYKGRQIIWGYDLLNEPYEGNPSPALGGWEKLATETAGEIRAIDPKRRIIFEPALDKLPESIKAGLKPLPISNVAYSFHIYSPGQYTHQGIHSFPSGITYPGKIGDSYWDKSRLISEYQSAIDFQNKYGVPIYVGEFSAIRWAPGAEQWLRDVTSIIEENGWNGAYHAFREWDGWSLEHDSNPNNHKPSNSITARGKIILGWFGQNTKK